MNIDMSIISKLKNVGFVVLGLFILFSVVGYINLKEQNKELMELNVAQKKSIESLKFTNDELTIEVLDLDTEFRNQKLVIEQEVSDKLKAEKDYRNALRDFNNRIEALKAANENERAAILNSKKNIRYEN
jgi:peptidoglycan hydrolase CwlO-like protein